MSAERISAIAAREVLDCRGLPTVQVELALEGGATGTADVPAGRSTGASEAFELRDGGTRFGGQGVLAAVENVSGEIAGALVGRRIASQRELDAALIELDGTEDKSRLGANAILGVSLAAARASASARGLELHRWMNSNSHLLPVPLVNLINGGRHASNDLDFQEFIVIPVGADSILEALQISSETNLALAEILLERYGKVALNTGDEGGFAPPISDPREALGLLHEAVESAGYTGRFRYGLDCAATHYYDRDSGTYEIAGERRDRDGMIELYRELIAEFDLVTIEDPLDEDDFEGFAELTRASGIQIVGDDLFVTNPRAPAHGDRAGLRQLAALEGQPDRHAQRGARRRRHRAPKRLHGGRLRALGRDGGSDHRRPRGGPRRRPDQDRRPGARRAHRQVQPAPADLRGPRRRGEVSGRRLREDGADGVTDGPERGVAEPAKPSRAPSDAVLPPPPSIREQRRALRARARRPPPPRPRRRRRRACRVRRRSSRDRGGGAHRRAASPSAAASTAWRRAPASSSSGRARPRRQSPPRSSGCSATGSTRGVDRRPPRRGDPARAHRDGGRGPSDPERGERSRRTPAAGNRGEPARRRPRDHLHHRRQLGADEPAARRRLGRREAPASRAAPAERHADHGGQRGSQARVGDQGRSPGRGDRTRPRSQPHGLRRRQGPARRHHGPQRPGHLNRRGCPGRPERLRGLGRRSRVRPRPPRHRRRREPEPRWSRHLDHAPRNRPERLPGDGRWRPAQSASSRPSSPRAWRARRGSSGASSPTWPGRAPGPASRSPPRACSSPAAARAP